MNNFNEKSNTQIILFCYYFNFCLLIHYNVLSFFIYLHILFYFIIHVFIKNVI